MICSSHGQIVRLIFRGSVEGSGFLASRSPKRHGGWRGISCTDTCPFIVFFGSEASGKPWDFIGMKPETLNHQLGDVIPTLSQEESFAQ